MRTDEPVAIRLIDYAPAPFAIDAVRLEFGLDADRTTVRAISQVRRTGAADAPLRLHGEALELVSVAVNAAVLTPDAYALDEEGLTLPGLPDAFTLTIETTFSPRANTALSGIYLSTERIFSQCEAEGFRRITYFLDRPDNLATYEVRIEADRGPFPTLLSNGNLIASGDLGAGRHFAEWADPFPKPSYLFALVAGDFDRLDDSFTTRSGKVVPLQIFVDRGDADRAAYAMDALKRSMAWDERRFGREYDLDLFMIVAVRDFNFGAMENKGLNIFNSSLLLADEATATDMDFEAIESVVAHEYFHNWTGNRITCRDWFQLCLKEGLTVFRDQEFSADERGAGEQRIKDVRALRARQFPEDAGPLAHPVRPSSFVKIDNFYTATVYEKGAEVIRMLRAMIGEPAFQRGMDIYFERCDGTAATVETFLACFAEAADQDLIAFMGWYEQAGTPRLTAHVAQDGPIVSVTLRQETPPTPGQPDKRALPVPVRIGLISANGDAAPVRLEGEPESAAAPERTLILRDAEATWRFVDAPPDAAVSLLRGFSAPVRLTLEEPAAHRARRARADTDLFNRWEAATGVVRDALLARIADPSAAFEPAAIETMADAVTLARDEPGMAALLLSPADLHELAQHVDTIDPDAIASARADFVAQVSVALHDQLLAAHTDLAPTGPFRPDAAGAGRRAARNAVLRLLAAGGDAHAARLAKSRLDEATNMTDAVSALATLDLSGSDVYDDALAAFYGRWHAHPLVIDKWFALQARTSRPDAVARVRALLSHPDYDERTPNRARAVLGGFAMGNLTGFHASNGAGYDLFVERVLSIDAKNPALAARLLGAFEVWPRLEPRRRSRAKAALERVQSARGVSRNMQEIASRSLSAEA